MLGYKKERGLSGAAGGGDHGVDVIGVHQSCNMVFGPFAAKDKALLFPADALPCATALVQKGTWA